MFTEKSESLSSLCDISITEQQLSSKVPAVKLNECSLPEQKCMNNAG